MRILGRVALDAKSDNEVVDFSLASAAGSIVLCGTGADFDMSDPVSSGPEAEADSDGGTLIELSKVATFEGTPLSSAAWAVIRLAVKSSLRIIKALKMMVKFAPRPKIVRRDKCFSAQRLYQSGRCDGMPAMHTTVVRMHGSVPEIILNFEAVLSG
jgi:hypothetical protein